MCKTLSVYIKAFPSRMIKLSSYFLGILAWYSNHWVAPVIYGLPVAWIGASTQTFLVAGMTKRDKEVNGRRVTKEECLEPS